MYELLKAKFRALDVHFKVLGDPLILLQWSQIKQMRVDKCQIGGKEITKAIKALVSGFTWKAWSEEYKKIANVREDRSVRVRGRFVIDQFEVKSGVDYGQFARDFWEKKGCPVFQKKIVSGVVWGRGHVRTNGKSGFKKVILSRVLGVRKIHKENGHVGLEISCPD